MKPNDASPAAWFSAPHHFVTVDAETELIPEGIRAIATIRDRLESEEQVEIPIVWFMRFQRTWDEYVEIDSPRYFSGPFAEVFDGFELAKPELRRLRARGDEIGWHYHAYNYVHRDDLAHERKIAILHADLAACQAEIGRRHGDLTPRSFRFGWFFVPDYGLFETLRAGGVRVDASVVPKRGGQKMHAFNATYPPPITSSPREVDGVWFVPFVRTSLVHDYQMVAHDLGWTRQDERQAADERRELEASLRTVARSLKESGGNFLTYERILPLAGS